MRRDDLSGVPTQAEGHPPRRYELFCTLRAASLRRRRPSLQQICALQDERGLRRQVGTRVLRRVRRRRSRHLQSQVDPECRHLSGQAQMPSDAARMPGRAPSDERRRMCNRRRRRFLPTPRLTDRGRALKKALDAGTRANAAPSAICPTVRRKRRRPVTRLETTAWEATPLREGAPFRNRAPTRP
jgi:hypothetical protein